MEKESKTSDEHPTGFTLKQLIIVASFIVGVIVILFGFLIERTSIGYIEEALSPIPYKCLTTSPDGIPLKVIVKNPKNAVLYKSADINSPPGKSSKLFEILYVYQRKNEFYQVGKDPFSVKTIGWVKSSEVMAWPNKYALRLKQNLKRAPIYIWEQKKDIGKGNWKFKQPIEGDYSLPSPIFTKDGDHYHIAFIWQKDANNFGADRGWTSGIKIPGDAEIVYYLTKKELKKRMQQILGVIKRMKDEPYISHPITKFFREILGISFGYEKNIKTEITAFINQMTEDSSKLNELLDQFPPEIRNQVNQLVNAFKMMEKYYQNLYYWDSEGRGWIPEPRGILETLTIGKGNFK